MIDFDFHHTRAPLNIVSLLLITLIFLSCDLNASDPPDSNGEIKYADIATWNIRILSDGSRDDIELQSIASVFSNFDFVAIQEIRDITVLDRLITFLDGWDYIVSEEVGNTVKERYAYFYKVSMFNVLGTPYVLNDPNNIFIREPYIAHFKSGEFDFTVITIHTIYGDTIDDRRAENALLDDVITLVDIANGNENDVLLMGDFNLPSDDNAWQITTHNAIVDPSIKTTITDTSSYDNVWVNPSYTSEYADSYSLYKFDEILFGNDDDAASLAVSDHRPVIAQFSFTTDDDLEGDWNTTSEITDPNDPNPPPLTTGDIRIESVISSPTEDEAITIKNYSAWIIDLTPWTLGDLNNSTAYNIPNGTTLEPDESRTYPGSTLGFAINNTGETIYLINDGGTIDTWTN
jgi:endonuclease/exonuclease/phosphatase family metal-dependent hydrolase